MSKDKFERAKDSLANAEEQLGTEQTNESFQSDQEVNIKGLSEFLIKTPEELRKLIETLSNDVRKLEIERAGVTKEAIIALKEAISALKEMGSVEELSFEERIGITSSIVRIADIIKDILEEDSDRIQETSTLKTILFGLGALIIGIGIGTGLNKKYGSSSDITSDRKKSLDILPNSLRDTLDKNPTKSIISIDDLNVKELDL